MAENNIIKKILRSYISQTFIAFFGIIGTAITIYAFLQEKKVELRYEILSNTNVLDFNAEVNKLNVTYDSTNLRQTRENLRIYTIKIVNTGEQTLTKNFYDENDLIGIKILNGKIIERPQIIKSSNKYVYRNAKIINYTKNEFKFYPIILEKGEFYYIKFLVLHKKNLFPKLIAIGKIADQKSIEFINAVDTKSDQSYLEKALYGNFWVQLFRLITYFIAGVTLLLLVLLLSDKVESILSKIQRKKLLNEFKKRNDYTYTKTDESIFERYINDDILHLREMYYLLQNEEKLNEKYSKSIEGLKSKNYKRIDSNRRIHYYSNDYHIINEMINDGIVFRQEEKLSINQPMNDTLQKFIAFLKTKNQFRSKNSLRYAKHIYYEDDQNT